MASMASIHPFTARASAASSSDAVSGSLAVMAPSAATQAIVSEIDEYVHYLSLARPDQLLAIRDMAKYLSGASMLMLGLAIVTWVLLP